MSSPVTAMQERVDQAAVLLRLDAVALSVMSAFDSAGIPTLLLKGPVTASWLYAERLDHPYGDVDLLVSPLDVRAAAAVLRDRGFVDFHANELGIYRPDQERAWVSGAAVVDLHSGIAGIPPAKRLDAWRLLWEGSEPFSLHQKPVRVACESDRALLLTLHAVQKLSGAKARRDLDCGIRLLSTQVWRAAAEQAERLDVLPCFTSGLSLAPEGRELLRTLQIPAVTSTYERLLRKGATMEALAIWSVSQRPRGERGEVVRRWLSVDDPASSERLAFRRVRALSRMPRALFQVLIAALSARTRRGRAGGSAGQQAGG